MYNAGDKGLEAAMEWFFMNLENPVASTPLLVPNPKKGAANSGEPDEIEPELDMNMVQML